MVPTVGRVMGLVVGWLLGGRVESRSPSGATASSYWAVCRVFRGCAVVAAPADRRTVHGHTAASAPAPAACSSGRRRRLASHLRQYILTRMGMDASPIRGARRSIILAGTH